MAKAAAIQHACSECGYTTGKWLGKCPTCGSWGTLVEERIAAVPKGATPGGRTAAAPPRRRRGGRRRADPDGRSRARPRSRRRARAREPRPRQRRPGDREVDAPAYGAPLAERRPAGPARHGRGVGGAGEAPRRPARRRSRRAHPGGDEPRRGLRHPRAGAARRVRDRLRADALRAGARLGAGLGGPGPRGSGQDAPRVEGAGDRHVPRRARDEGRKRRGAARPRAPRRLRPALRGRPLPLAPRSFAP